ncbi:MAG: flippase [Candidatus Kuenenia sp.]|nr:flippase [Candidatus Kuenenia hertensis]
MNTGIKTRVVKNTLFVLLAQITNILLQMLYLIVTARYLGNVQFGKLSFAMVFTQMFLAVTDFGLFNYVVREISKKKEVSSLYFVNLFVLKGFLGLCVLFVIAFIVLILRYPPDTIITTCLFGIGLCLFSLNTTFHAVFQSHEKLKYIGITMILYYCVNVLLSVIALSYGENIITLAWINCLAGVVVFFVNLTILCKKFFAPKFVVDMKLCKEMLRCSLPIGIGAISWTFYNRIDVTLLSFMKGEISVGEYTAAYRLINTLAFIPSAYMSAVFPLMANQYKEKPTLLLQELSKKSCRLLIIISMPIMVILSIYAPQIIVLIYGKIYINAVIPLRILSCTVLLLFVNHIFSYLLISTFRTSKEYSIYALLGLIVNIVCNCIFIPILDLNGAAISTVITEALILSLYYRSIKRKGFDISLLLLGAKPFLASFTIIWIIYSLRTVHMFLVIPVAFMAYVLLLLGIKGIRREEMVDIFKSLTFNKLL